MLQLFVHLFYPIFQKLINRRPLEASAVEQHQRSARHGVRRRDLAYFIVLSLNDKLRVAGGRRPSDDDDDDDSM